MLLCGCPPYYLKYETQGEIIRHYEAVHNAIETELVIYNIPQFAGTCIAPKTLVELSNLERVVSIKDSNPNWEAVQNVLLLKRDHGFSYLVGNEDNGAPGMLFGGDGCVPFWVTSIPSCLLTSMRQLNEGMWS